MSETVTVIEVAARIRDETAQGARSVESTITKLERSMQNLSQRIVGLKGKSKLEVKAELKDMASKGLEAVARKGKQIAGKVWTVTLKAVDLVTKPFKKIWDMVSNPMTAAVSFAGLSLGIGDAVNTYKDFQAGMSQVSAISGAVGKDLEELTEKAREMGKTTKFTSTEAAEAFNYMAMAGWKTKDMLGGIEGVMNLAAASGEDLGTVSDILTDAMTAFGLAADGMTNGVSNATHFADILAQASSNANTNVAMMGETFKYVAPIAGSLGITAEDTAEMIGLMANGGIKASQAGTALRSIITRLSTDAGASSKSLGALGTLTKELGVDFYDAYGNVRDFSDVIDEAREAWKGLTDDEKSKFGKKIAGQTGLSGWSNLMEATTKDVDKLRDSIENCDGASKRMAETMQDNMQGSFEKLQSAFGGVQETVGAKLEPYIRGLVDFITAHMPDIEKAVGGAVDFVTGKIDSVIKSVKDMTNSPEWAAAETLWDKIKLSWDKLIAQPFGNWWNGSGKQMIAEKAADIGKGIGTALHDGLVGLFGFIDVEGGGLASDGVSIGKSFASGFLEGFNGAEVAKAIVTSLKTAFKALVSDAATLLPGGEEASATSGISAAILGLGAAKVGATGYKAYKGTKAIAGGVKGIGTAIAGSGLGEGILLARGGAGAVSAETLAAAENGTLGFTSRLGMQIGANATKVIPIVGGVVSAIGAGVDAYHGTQNAEEWTGSDSTGAKVASGIGAFLGGTGDGVTGDTSALNKGLNIAGGALKGAGIGAAIGTIVPVFGTGIGAAVGAGVGAIGAAVGGSNIAKGISNAWDTITGAEKDETETNREANKEAKNSIATTTKAKTVLELTGHNMRNLTFKNKDLQNALNDTNVSAEDFSNAFKQEKMRVAASSFGDLSLSLGEVQEAAKQLALDGIEGKLDKFASATSGADTSLTSLKDSISNLESVNWKASLGIKLNESDKETFKASIDSFVNSAKSYVESKHYEAAVSMKLLMGKDADMSGLDTMYEKMEKRIDKLNTKFVKEFEIAIKDGKIDADEEAILQKYQDKITEITEKLSKAQTDAKFDVLKIKFAGAALDEESFTALQEQLHSEIESAASQFDDALTVTLTNLHLELENGAIDQDTFKSLREEAINGYNNNIGELSARVESFNIENISEAFQEELKSIELDPGDTIQKKLTEAMNEALSYESDVNLWTQDKIIKWFGLESIDAVDASVIADRLKETAAAVPKGMEDAIQAAVEEANLPSSIEEAAKTKLEETDFSGALKPLSERLKEDMSGVDCTAAGNVLGESLGAALEKADTKPIESAVKSLKKETDSSVNSIFMDVDSSKYSNAGKAVTGGIQGSINSADREPISSAVTTLKSDTDTLANTIFMDVDSSKYSNAGEGVTGGVGDAISNADRGGITAAVDGLKADTDAAVDSAFSDGITTTMPVKVKFDYDIINPEKTFQLSGEGVTGSASINVKAHAEGGIMTKPHFGLVAEDGAEAIVPLSDKRKNRGIQIWKQAGEMLGMFDDEKASDNKNGSGSRSVSGVASMATQIVKGSADRILSIATKADAESKRTSGVGKDTNSYLKTIASNVKAIAKSVGVESKRSSTEDAAKTIEKSMKYTKGTKEAADIAVARSAETTKKTIEKSTKKTQSDTAGISGKLPQLIRSAANTYERLPQVMKATVKSVASTVTKIPATAISSGEKSAGILRTIASQTVRSSIAILGGKTSVSDKKNEAAKTTETSRASVMSKISKLSKLGKELPSGIQKLTAGIVGTSLGGLRLKEGPKTATELITAIGVSKAKSSISQIMNADETSKKSVEQSTKKANEKSVEKTSKTAEKTTKKSATGTTGTRTQMEKDVHSIASSVRSIEKVVQPEEEPQTGVDGKGSRKHQNILEGFTDATIATLIASANQIGMLDAEKSRKEREREVAGLLGKMYSDKQAEEIGKFVTERMSKKKSAEPVPSSDKREQQSLAPVTIGDIKVEIHVEATSSEPQAIADAVKKNVRSMTDEIAHQLATSLQKVYKNMPKQARS